MGRVSKITVWGIGLLMLVYLIQYPIQKDEATWGAWSLPLSGKVIVIDPGHGGPDGGAEGIDGTQEKGISLAVSEKLRDYLQQSGALVYLTREEDNDLADTDTAGLSRRKSEDIRKRLQFIHDKEADFFVTIHLNAIPSPRWSGAQTFYYPEFPESKHLAQKIQAEIVRNLENTDRAALAINGIYLLKHAEVPGSLVEIGFLSNEQERELLKEESYQRQMAGSIYEGILRYMTEEVVEEEE
jgi:N-acetylmuramoyl-L-alanine amidase